MTTVTLVFHDNLKELLAHDVDEKGAVLHCFDRRASVKDVIESFGVPHPEIQWLKVNGTEVGFDNILQDNDFVEISPLTPPFNVLTATVLRPEPIKAIRFVVDVNVGKLATLLRIAGFDTAYDNDLNDIELARIAEKEQRILLTRDTHLLKRKNVLFGHLVREIQPQKQLVEVIRLFQLKTHIRPYTRCLLCNALLKPVAKQEIMHRLKPLTRKYYDTFHLCPECDKIYWPGSHRDKMQDYIMSLSGL